MTEQIKNFFDWLAYILAGGALFKIIPAVAGVFSIVWLGWQMYDRIKYGPKHKD